MIDAVEDLLRVTPRFDQIGFSQHAQLLAQARLADPCGVLDLADRSFAIDQRAEQRQAHLMRQSAQQFGACLQIDLGNVHVQRFPSGVVA